MTLAIPCDACGTSLRRDVVALRFATLSLGGEGAAPAKGAPEAREHLVCPACASYVQACIAALEGRLGEDPISAREVAS